LNKLKGGEELPLSEAIRRQARQGVEGAARDVCEVVTHLQRSWIPVHRVQHIELIDEGVLRVD
jgi:hypothetical protein